MTACVGKWCPHTTSISSPTSGVSSPPLSRRVHSWHTWVRMAIVIFIMTMLRLARFPSERQPVYSLFPMALVFGGTMNPAFRQIGNAVPPLLAKALATEGGVRPPASAMMAKLAVKRLSASDLTFFEWHFRHGNAGNQKAINLNANVFKDDLYPVVDVVAQNSNDRLGVDLWIAGPGRRISL